MTRTERLRDFVSACYGKPMAWGVDDCTALAARWIEAETGVVVGLPPYADAEAAHALIAAAGGLVDLWRAYLDPIGIFETFEPQPGDVAVIPTRIAGPVGVIWAENGMVWWRESKGMTLLQPRQVLASWAIRGAS